MDRDGRLQRDLCWCLESAALRADASWSEIDGATAEGASLEPPPHPHRFRLGRHFEQLLLGWIAAHPDLELVDSNLQVMEGKRTVGEFDLLVRRKGEVEHWEAAIKFYLGTGDRTDAAHWFGPNTSDRLDLKLARLDQHQLTLSRLTSARQQLAARGIEVARSRLFMKGRLFHPWGQVPVAPPAINPRHERGWWLSLGDFQAAFVDAAARFVYLPKSLWLSTLAPGDVGAPLSFWEVIEFLESGAAEQATHLAVVDERGEVSRGFVVNEEWLTRVNAPASG